jgi:hypothetical protein
MTNLDLNMDEVYSTDGENIRGNNPEITLQFGDFGSSILESAEETENHVTSVHADVNTMKDSLDAVSDLLSGVNENICGDYGGLPGVESEQQLFTLEEVLQIVKFSN